MHPAPPRRFVRLARRRVLGREVPVAAGPLARLAGLALLNLERAGPGLLIPRCRSVHTFGMRFALDITFLDAEGRVLSEHPGIPPNRVLLCRRASAVLEVPSRSGGGEFLELAT